MTPPLNVPLPFPEDKAGRFKVKKKYNILYFLSHRNDVKPFSRYHSTTSTFIPLTSD